MYQRRVFTEAEDTFIMDNYNKMAYRDIASALGRTLHSIKHRTQHLGIDKTVGRRWTSEEDEVIRNRGDRTVKDVAEQLGRNVSVVYKRVRQLGERKRDYQPQYREESNYIVHRGSDRIFRHRAVMEEYLGRIIEPGEVIHHIDVDERCNEIVNLYLCDNASHKRMHNQLRSILTKLIRNGTINFNGDKGEYELCETVQCKKD